MSRLRWTVLTVGVATVGAGAAAAQVAPRPVPALLITSVEATGRPANVDPLRIVERLMSFDVDLDDRLNKDELPERMQLLMERADKDRDGFLTKDEIRTAPAGASPARRGIVRTGPGEGLSGVIRDLRLPPAKHEQALAIVARAPSVPRNINDASTVDVHARLRELLDDEEYENFVAAATRLQGPNVVIRGVVGGIPAPQAR